MEKGKRTKRPKPGREKVLRISLGSKVNAWLADLARYGIYGKTPEEVAERFICEGVRRQLEAGGILREPPPGKS